MSLRDIVAGSDSCTTGAGPSNAMGTLVNSLLGGPSKAQEQLRELPSFRPPALAMGPGAPDAAALALSGGSSLQIPGVGLSRMAIPEAEAIFQGVIGQNAEWDSIFKSAPTQMGPVIGPPGAMAMPPMPKDEATMAIETRIRNFFEHTRATHVTGAPLMLPAIPPELALKLSVADKTRIRNRVTILSRQMHSEKGDQFADSQVTSLLASLGVQGTDAVMAAGAMPHIHDAQWHDVWAAEQQKNAAAAMSLQNASWNQIWSEKGAMNGVPPPPGMAAAAHQMRQMGGGAGWAEEFATHGPEGAGASATTVPAAPGEAWATEFAETEAATSAAGTDAGTSAAARATTAAMVDAMQRSGDPKLQNSKFMQLMQAMSRGEVELGANKIVERSEAAAAATSSSWAEEFDQQQQQMPQMASGLGAPGGWAEEFASGVANMSLGGGAAAEMESAWKEAGGMAAQAEAEALAGGEPDWVREFKENEGIGEADFGELDHTHGHMGLGVSAGSEQYVFQADNPFAGDPAALEKGKDLFSRGVLSEAALALESVVQANPQDAAAWRLLGTVQAENEDDAQAIAALERALAVDPNDREAMLALGVCYTNENHRLEAVTVLRRVLAVHPREALRKLEADAGFALESSQRLPHVVRLFEAAAAQVDASSVAEADADVFVALGVLQHLDRRREAVNSFEQALRLRPSDYSLWNKLGATLANQSRPDEAIQAYQRALDLKSNYMRAWNNLGIAHGIRGNHLEGARYYVQALGLNPQASATWEHLMICAQHADRVDLVRAVNDRDLAYLQQQLPL